MGRASRRGSGRSSAGGSKPQGRGNGNRSGASGAGRGSTRGRAPPRGKHKSAAKPVLRKQSTHPRTSTPVVRPDRAVLEHIDQQASILSGQLGSNTMRGESSGLYCATCSLYYPTQQLLDDHFASKRHKKKARENGATGGEESITFIEPLAGVSSTSSMNQLAAEIVLPADVASREEQRRSEESAFGELLALNMDLGGK
eukprot:CAMPEP_0177649420 /NCGR_PEP_ID=MMETSP0447-20121125/11374_1 /TAXON_ID=0 /ORGANISM="Stygamoeba regulata, Strain BSH-02190019" /LENGTH=198 /DNA_ID=CAMNT_0019152171 /DNA_START=39 /DNA_END=635 /DNA_ORIENTATION=-